VRPAGLLIGLDFDNTLVDYTGPFRREAAAVGLAAAGLDKTGIRDALRARGPEGEILWQRLQARVYGPGLAQAPMMAGAGAFLARCAAEGVAVAVVSHKSRFAAQDPGGTDLRQAARAWLLHNCPGIATDRVYFEGDRGSKLKRIAALGCSHFVDDLLEVLTDPAFPAGVVRLWLADPPGRNCPTGIAASGPWPELAQAILGG
jgi:hypothetical protein